MASLISHELTIERPTPADPNPQYQRYPLTMVHPGFVAGHVGTEIQDKSGFKHFVGGRGAQFAPVIVKNEDQEESHAAMGYIPAGKTDPVAWVTAHSHAIEVNSYTPQEYPKRVGDVDVYDKDEEARVRAKMAADEARQAEQSRQAALNPVPIAVTVPVETGHIAAEVDALKADMGELRAMMGQLLNIVSKPTLIAEATTPAQKPKGKPGRPPKNAAAAAPPPEPEPEAEVDPRGGLFSE